MNDARLTNDVLAEYSITASMVKDEIIALLHWYNHTRLHSTMAYVRPMQFEENWLSAKPPHTSQ